MGIDNENKSLAPSRPVQPTERIRVKPPAVPHKVRRALLLMIHDGLPEGEAVRQVGLRSIYSLREALEQPHVVQFVRLQKHVVRESISTANIRKLGEIRDKSENAVAQVRAIGMLEDMGEQERVRSGGAAPAAPGLVIQIVGTDVGRSAVTIEHAPQVVDDPDKSD